MRLSPTFTNNNNLRDFANTGKTCPLLKLFTPDNTMLQKKERKKVEKEKRSAIETIEIANS